MSFLTSKKYLHKSSYCVHLFRSFLRVRDEKFFKSLNETACGVGCYVIEI